jgi:xanthine dehydrogenase YagS FAD-binding subunit
MHPFSFTAVTSEGQALTSKTSQPNAVFVAGGTSLLDIMKLGVENPDALVDINHVPLTKIEAHNGGLRIEANVKNTDVAYHPQVREQYPVLSEAILSGASAQLRNMASTGGNLLQRTRCYYYRDTSYACNMREPGSGCSAIDGFNRIHAILGTSTQCIATHPSDMCVALAALDTTVVVHGPGGERRIAFDDFYVPYGESPHQWCTLRSEELIVAVEIPALPMARQSRYLKVRDRASYEFALSSIAAILDVQGGTIRDARVALGGVATKPWRSREAEQALIGKPANRDTYQAAAEAALQTARPQKFNAFKIELTRRTIVRGLEMTANGEKSTIAGAAS